MMETGDIDTMNVSALLDRPAGAQQTGVRRSQVLLCAVTIAACVPYLLLKLLWLSGNMVGWHDTAQGGDMVHLVGNAVTLGMDLLAIVIVLVFTCRWGERIPAWLVLLPMWVATGLLAPIALGVPVGALAGAVRGSAAIAADNGLDGWVYAIVYGGFTVQAVAIEAAFVRYARTRWADVFQMRLVDLRRAATYPIQRLIAVASAFVVVPYAAMFVAWGLALVCPPIRLSPEPPHRKWR